MDLFVRLRLTPTPFGAVTSFSNLSDYKRLMLYVPRALGKILKKEDKQFPVLLITGARQVGKITLLQHLSYEKIVYITLDDPLLLTLVGRFVLFR
jgi:predicted AAA+ superfamily ATPase